MARYHGKRGNILISTSGSGTAATAVSLSGWSLDLATDMVEVTSFGDPNKTYVQGLKDVKGTFKGFLDDTGLSIFTSADSTDGCKIYLYPSTDSPSIYWCGPAWLNASVDVPVGGANTVTANFTANGAWIRKP